jgi:hypothetical protein
MHYLGVTSAVNIPERLAGRQYLEQFNVGDIAIVIYEWVRGAFSAGAAIRLIPGFFYVACDLYPAEHPRVIGNRLLVTICSGNDIGLHSGTNRYGAELEATGQCVGG